MKRGQEYTDYINASFIDVCIAAPYVFGATWDSLLYEHMPLSVNTALHAIRIFLAELLVLKITNSEPSLLVHTCNPNTQELETGIPGVQR